MHTSGNKSLSLSMMEEDFGKAWDLIIIKILEFPVETWKLHPPSCWGHTVGSWPMMSIGCPSPAFRTLLASRNASHSFSIPVFKKLGSDPCAPSSASPQSGTTKSFQFCLINILQICPRLFISKTHMSRREGREKKGKELFVFLSLKMFFYFYFK